MTGRHDHERARELAAARPDGFLTPSEAAWLDAHLATCDDCSAIAAAYGAQRSLFDVARGAYPETPRDLWARTAAAIEAGGGRRGMRRSWRPSLAYAPLAGALVVAIVVGSGLLNGLPAQDSTSKGEEPEATPFALAAGEVQVVSRGDDGALRLRRQPVAEVCPVAADSCGLSPNPARTTTELQTTASEWDAIISPDEEQVIVVERGDGAQGVYVLIVTDPEVAALPSDEPAASHRPPPAGTPSTEPASASPEPTSTPDASPSVRERRATRARRREPTTIRPSRPRADAHGRADPRADPVGRGHADPGRDDRDRERRRHRRQHRRVLARRRRGSRSPRCPSTAAPAPTSSCGPWATPRR